MSIATENKNKTLALAFSIGFHAVLFLLFILIVFVTPIPPFEIKPSPEIEIGLGMEGYGDRDAGGSGQKDADIKTTTEEAAPQSHQTVTHSSASAPPIITDETETQAHVNSNPKSSSEQNNAEAPKIEEPKPSTELLNALNALKNKKSHTGNGQGGGNTGGSGNGTAQGVGDGDGMGHGDGTPGWNGSGKDYNLKGRRLLKKPEQMTDSQEEGTVVVEIIVDETGRVTKATPGQRGTTTTSANLFAKARQAALTAKFDASPDGIKEQRGTYTFVFVLE